MTVQADAAHKPDSVGEGILWWFLTWPGLARNQSAGPPTAAQLSERVNLFVQLSSDRPATFAPATDTDRAAEIRLLTAQLTGPYRNRALDLMEYRSEPASDIGRVYVLPDDVTLPSAISRPYVTCGATAADEWGGFRHCQVWGAISPRIRYRYEFSDRILGELHNLHPAIEIFLTTVIVDHR
jgi:hypothetical protein